ncbi:hypothetical protein BS50DRAFT_636226 [Corynespora cassiicola Philippines]|uniref:Uncharacterized protein n=1 Tax=Corynespora cassiicola Philippines TaxID=1448308 RepID=A0A2T2NJ47_CORCC|nr:hypothetical protein BS50DRAFT_636226 [Corynespora cassiicola Philippines]
MRQHTNPVPRFPDMAAIARPQALQTPRAVLEEPDDSPSLSNDDDTPDQTTKRREYSDSGRKTVLSSGMLPERLSRRSKSPANAKTAPEEIKAAARSDYPKRVLRRSERQSTRLASHAPSHHDEALPSVESAVADASSKGKPSEPANDEEGTEDLNEWLDEVLECDNDSELSECSLATDTEVEDGRESDAISSTADAERSATEQLAAPNPVPAALPHRYEPSGQPVLRFEYDIPDKLKGVAWALPESDWFEYVWLMEQFVQERISEERLVRRTDRLFRTYDLEMRGRIRRMVNKMVLEDMVGDFE